MDNETSFKFGDKVEIGGRTMLRPGFSLVGLTGMISLTAPGAPAGCVTVVVDWAAFEYTEENGYPEGSLPPAVNVPAAHLILMEENPTTLGIQKPTIKTDPNVPKRPMLGVIEGGESHKGESHKDEAGQHSHAKDDENDEPRPKLRLV